MKVTWLPFGSEAVRLPTLCQSAKLAVVKRGKRQKNWNTWKRVLLMSYSLWVVMKKRPNDVIRVFLGLRPPIDERSPPVIPSVHSRLGCP
jgi:hypothetical protein